MVLYRSPEQTDLHTYITVEVAAKFTALNFIVLHHFCQVILKLVQWFLTKRFVKGFI